MKNRTLGNKLSVLAGTFAALLLCGSAYAQHAGGGGGGGGHAGGSGHAVAGGGFHGGYASGGYTGGGYHGGYYGGGYRGGYYGGGYHGGYRGGYYGWRGGYYGGWGCCGWGWGWGYPLALGLYVATLPYYYTTVWYGGIPYYYADNTYYQWDPNASQYVTVGPPAGAPPQASAPAGSGGPPSGSMDLMAYPKNGQTTEQQAKDKFDCHQWAVTQSGFDPTLGSSSAPASKSSDYMRAQAACLEGRGYSVQ